MIEWFKENYLGQKPTQEMALKVANELIQLSIKKEHFKKEVINTYETFLLAKELYVILHNLARSFYQDAKIAFNSYLAKTNTGIDDVQLLINSKHLFNTEKFLLEEADVLSESIQDCKLFMKSCSFKEYLMFVFQGYDKRVIERKRTPCD